MATGDTDYRISIYTDWSIQYRTIDEGTNIPESAWSNIYDEWAIINKEKDNLNKNFDWDPETN